MFLEACERARTKGGGEEKEWAECGKLGRALRRGGGEVRKITKALESVGS